MSYGLSFNSNLASSVVGGLPLTKEDSQLSIGKQLRPVGCDCSCSCFLNNEFCNMKSPDILATCLYVIPCISCHSQDMFEFYFLWDREQMIPDVAVINYIYREIACYI